MGSMASDATRPHRPARVGRWVATGLTAAATVGVVGAMAQSAEPSSDERAGAAMGSVARYEGEVAALAMMAAADPGDTTPTPVPPPRIARADVS